MSNSPDEWGKIRLNRRKSCARCTLRSTCRSETRHFVIALGRWYFRETRGQVSRTQRDRHKRIYVAHFCTPGDDITSRSLKFDENIHVVYARTSSAPLNDTRNFFRPQVLAFIDYSEMRRKGISQGKHSNVNATKFHRRDKCSGQILFPRLRSKDLPDFFKQRTQWRSKSIGTIEAIIKQDNLFFLYSSFASCKNSWRRGKSALKCLSLSLSFESDLNEIRMPIAKISMSIAGIVCSATQWAQRCVVAFAS